MTIRLKKNNSNIEIIANSVYKTIKNGGLVLMPDSAGYGLIGNSKKSIEKIYELKKRSLLKPLTHYMSLKHFHKLLDIPKKDSVLIKKIASLFPCCFVVSYESNHYFEKLSVFAFKQSTRSGTVAFYFDEENLLVQKIISLAQKDTLALIVSSANISGTGNKYNFNDLPQKITSAVNLAIQDPNSCKYKNDTTTKNGTVGATIIDMHNKKILRKGLFSREIYILLRKVC